MHNAAPCAVLRSYYEPFETTLIAASLMNAWLKVALDWASA